MKWRYYEPGVGLYFSLFFCLFFLSKNGEGLQEKFFMNCQTLAVMFSLRYTTYIRDYTMERNTEDLCQQPAVGCVGLKMHGAGAYSRWREFMREEW